MTRPGSFVAVAVLLAGCATNRLTPVDAARAAVGDTIADAERRSSNQSEFTVLIRYNPADCECPDWEVYAWGRWVRAYVQGRPEALAPLESLRNSQDPVARASITGTLDERARLSRRNVRYPVFLVSAR